MAEMLKPPAPVAGLAVPEPFQLPLGATRNQIKPAVKSTAMPMTLPDESPPMLPAKPALILMVPFPNTTAALFVPSPAMFARFAVDRAHPMAVWLLVMVANVTSQ